MTERYFASCPRGLEGALRDELAAIGAQEPAAADGGVAFAGGHETAMRANLESRIASRVLWRVAGGRYRSERDVHAIARAVDWKALFRVDRTLRVDVAATRSPLKSLEFAALTTKDAVCDRFRDDTGRRPSVDKRLPDVRIHVHLTTDTATLYLDTSGDPLFKRGYRRDSEEAPMRENLAAGLCALAGWRGVASAPVATSAAIGAGPSSDGDAGAGTTQGAFLDPMCGSGTIAIEAAMIAADRAPGLSRSFGFQKLAWFDGPPWQRMKQAARDRVRSAGATPRLFARDIAAPAIAKAQANAQAAGVAEWLAFARADFLDADAPAPAGTLIANPPYGVRLSDRDALAALYPRIGDTLKQRYAGWTAWLFSADTSLPKLMHLKATSRTPLYNGALECRLYQYPLTRGAMVK